MVCEVARELGALTVGVITRPFNFEGRRRRRQAEEGIEGMMQHVDTLITIPNQRLLSVATERTQMGEAFTMADDVLLQAVKGISDLINGQGLINVDFADVKTIMANKGLALMGVGMGSGQHRTVDAAQRAISSPLLDDVSISGATSVLLNFTGSSNLTLYEVNEAAQMVAEETAEDENVIFGLVIDESMGDNVRVTVIATGFQDVRSASTGSSSRGSIAPERTGGMGNRPMDADRQLRKVVSDSFHTPTRTGGRPSPMGSGFDTLKAEDYDIPTFFRSKD